MDKTSRNILTIILIIIIFYLLYELSSILLPLVLALLFALLFQPVVMFLRKIKIPRFIIIPIVSAISLLIFYGLLSIIIQTSTEIYEQQEYFAERLQLRMNDIIHWANQTFDLSLRSKDILKYLQKNVFDVAFISQTVSTLAMGAGSLVGSFVMFSIYYVVLLAGISNYKEYIQYIGEDFDKQAFLENYEKIQKSILSYITLKTIINLIQGVTVALICWGFGLKFPLFIGLMCFIFHYIPNIGSILATIIPALLGIIQFDSFNTILLIILLISGVQFILGNFIEPLVMGTKLRINTLTVIFGLVFWGYIWGVPGMMLSVPLLVIVKLILENIPDLKFLAKVMSYPEKK